jgi:hypothetical protein
VYGEPSEVTDLNQSSLTPNKIRTSISYETFHENNYPFPVQHFRGIIHGPAMVYAGTVISKNTSNDLVPLSKLTSRGSMELQQHEVPDQNIYFTSLEGDSLDGASFGADSLNYSGRYISLNFGNIEKHPESNQISFVFHIKAEKGNYKLIFVNGRANSDSWNKDTFIQHLPQGSSKLVDLVKMVSSFGDKFKYLDKIQLNIEKGTLINHSAFRIDLGKSTINTPGVINENISYFVDGLIFKDKIISTKYFYLFQDGRFKQILNQEFEIESDDEYVVKDNGWKINEMKEFKDNRTGKTIVNLVSEKNVNSKPLPILDILQHINIYNSLMATGTPKDILFIAVFVLIVFLFYPKVNGIGRILGK